MEQRIDYTPDSIQLLFNNPKLEMAKILGLLNALHSQKRKQTKLEEVLFYYSIVEFNLKNLFNQNEKTVEVNLSPTNQYLRFQLKLNKLLIILHNLNFIIIKGKLSNKIEDLKIILLPQGKDFFNENSTQYLNSLLIEYIDVYKTIPYCNENLKKIKEGLY